MIAITIFQPFFLIDVVILLRIVVEFIVFSPKSREQRKGNPRLQSPSVIFGRPSKPKSRSGRMMPEVRRAASGSARSIPRSCRPCIQGLMSKQIEIQGMASSCRGGSDNVANIMHNNSSLNQHYSQMETGDERVTPCCIALGRCSVCQLGNKRCRF